MWRLQPVSFVIKKGRQRVWYMERNEDTDRINILPPQLMFPSPDMLHQFECLCITTRNLEKKIPVYTDLEKFSVCNF